MKLWFVVPVHPDRVKLAAICLRQLRRTCDSLTAEGIRANGVIIATGGTLDSLGRLGGICDFGTIRRNNDFLGRRFNDGIQLATDPKYNPRPVDYVVPCGSDDWVDYRLFLDLPPTNTVVGFQTLSFVREDGQEITTTRLGYRGGSGIRIIPRQLVKPLGYRPADEDRRRGCDTSILNNLLAYHGDRLRIDDERHLHDRQIVDWKTPGVQLNPYTSVTAMRSQSEVDPFEELSGFYPDEAIEEMCHHYAGARVRVPA